MADGDGTGTFTSRIPQSIHIRSYKQSFPIYMCLVWFSFSVDFPCRISPSTKRRKGASKLLDLPKVWRGGRNASSGVLALNGSEICPSSSMISFWTFLPSVQLPQNIRLSAGGIDFKVCLLVLLVLPLSQYLPLIGVGFAIARNWLWL